MSHKLILDEVNNIIKLDNLYIDTAENVKIEIDDFSSESKVTLTFSADVTIIPPERDANN